MTKKEAAELIASKISLIYEITAECKSIADEHGICFEMDVDGEYGTGATYSNGEWAASSNSC